MFFQHNTCSHQSRIDLLFDKSDLKLQEVLEHVEVLQEAKNKNKLLLKYLTSNEVLFELIGIIITEPPEDLSDDVRFKLPHIASELLNCDIPVINELLSSSTLLEHLYSFIEQDSPLNPLLSSFFSKAFGVLMKRSIGQNWYEYQVFSINFYNFLKEKDFINHLLKHIRTSAISDLVIKLMTSAEEGVKINILKWLDEQDLIGSIIKLLDPSHDADMHESACFLLIEILEASLENQSKQSSVFMDPILVSLESPATIEALLERILGSEKSESIIINGVSVFLALLDSSSFGDYKTSDEVRETITRTLVPAIPSFTSLLLDPPAKPNLKTTAGALEPPLGSTRLSIAKLIAALLTTNNIQLNNELTRSKTLDILLNLFFKYPLNNFLHYQVVACILSIFNWKGENKAIKVLDFFSSHDDIMFKSYERKESLSGPEAEEPEVEENPLLVHLYTDCKLVERILEAWEENNSGPHRKGYMAHLTKIANIMQEYSTKSSSQKLIAEQIQKLPESTRVSWEEFVSNDLVEINKKNTINLSVLADLNNQRQFESETIFKNILNLGTGSDDNNLSKNIEISDLKSVDCLAWMKGDDSSARNFDDDIDDDDDEDIMKDEENDNEWENADSQIAIDSGNPWENIDNQGEGIESSNTNFWASFNDIGTATHVSNDDENMKEENEQEMEEKVSKDSEKSLEESPLEKSEDSKVAPPSQESNSAEEEKKVETSSS